MSADSLRMTNMIVTREKKNLIHCLQAVFCIIVHQQCGRGLIRGVAGRGSGSRTRRIQITPLLLHLLRVRATCSGTKTWTPFTPQEFRGRVEAILEKGDKVGELAMSSSDIMQVVMDNPGMSIFPSGFPEE